MAKKLQIKKGTFIGDSFLGSPIIYNIADTSLLSVGDVVAHADGLQVESKILSIDSATQITLDKNAVATHTGTTFTTLIDDIIVNKSNQIAVDDKYIKFDDTSKTFNISHATTIDLNNDSILIDRSNQLPGTLVISDVTPSNNLQHAPVISGKSENTSYPGLQLEATIPDSSTSLFGDMGFFTRNLNGGVTGNFTSLENKTAFYWRAQPNQLMNLSRDGKLFIGTTNKNATEKLEVEGNILSSGVHVFDTGDFTTTLTPTINTSNQIITIPDKSGTLALLDEVANVTNLGSDLIFTGGVFTHSNTIAPGSTSNNGNITLAYDGTFKVPTLVYDANGHITGISYDSLTLPPPGGYIHDTFTYTTSADTETLLTSIPLLTNLSVNNEGHVSSSEYRKLVAGDYVNITASADGNITISADSEPYVAGTGLTLDGQTFNHSNSITASTASGSSGGTSFGGTVNIPSITYDAQGHITAKGTTSITLPNNIDTYLSSITWTNGTTSGPTGTATLNDSSTVSIPAIPSASISQSGIITTGSQSFNGDKTFDDNVIINKNLTVHGTMTTKDTQQVNIGDNIVLLNAEEAGTPSENAGIEVERGTSANTSLLWNESSDRWTFTNNGTTYYNIPLPTEYNKYVHDTFAGDDFSIDTGALTGATVISDLDINLTTNTEGHVTDANATVATRNLTLGDLGYVAPGDGQLTLNTSGSGISGSATFKANQTSASTFTVTSNATIAANANTIVLRDSNANIRTHDEVQATNFSMKYDSTSKSVKFVFA